MANGEEYDIPAVPAKKCFFWQSICAALTIIIVVLSALLLWPEKKDDIVIDIEFSEAAFYSGNGHSLRYRIIPDSVSSTCSYQLMLTPETPVAGAPAPVELDVSTGVFQGELTFPLTASTWSVSLRITSPNEVRIVPVAAGLHYRDAGMVSWDPVLK